MKNRRFSAQLLSALVLAAGTLVLTSCAHKIYYYPQYGYAGRPVPPSGLLQRVLASYTANGTSGGLEILDGLRNLRGNIQNTTPSFFVSGFSASQPVQIFNFPEQQRGYILSYTDGSLDAVNYSTEAGSGAVESVGANPPSVAAAPDGSVFAGASEASGQVAVTAYGGSYALSLPNVNKVVINRGANIILAMLRNSNTLYRVVKLPSSNNPVPPPGAIDCQPLLLPLFCVVPVGNTNSAGTPGAAYDHPIDAYFSLDGNTVYIMNCGPECGGTRAGVTFLQTGALDINNVPTVNPLSAATPLSPIGVANPIAIPGGVTTAVSDGTTLYLSGQSIQTGGLLGGNLTSINLNTYVASSPLAISDGTHTRMLFADDSTLWVGSTQCANGVRAAKAASELASQGFTDQAGNYNCLTMVKLGATPTATIIPAVVQSSVSGTKSVQVSYPNTNQNLYYYGSLTGICWIENDHKVYTAYGGQIHAFYTGGTINTAFDPALGQTPAAGTEIDNSNVTVQGTVLDVAYMDATTNSVN
ncbi:MAG: hypothetical protein V4555_21855 [Acidobacteriota bacterium]